MKVCMFHLMPYRDLPADFDAALPVGLSSIRCGSTWPIPKGRRNTTTATLDEMLYAAQGRHARSVHQPASPERLRLHGQSEPHGRGAGEAHQRPERRHHPARLDPALDDAADAHRRGIRHARLHQRRPAGCGISDRAADRRDDLQRRRADRAARALPRGAGAGAQGVVGAGRISPGTASIISSAWSISGRGRSSSRIRRCGFPAPAFPPPPNMSSSTTIASAI